jgi:hypothetical protein
MNGDGDVPKAAKPGAYLAGLLLRRLRTGPHHGHPPLAGRDSRSARTTQIATIGAASKLVMRQHQTQRFV